MCCSLRKKCIEQILRTTSSMRTYFNFKKKKYKIGNCGLWMTKWEKKRNARKKHKERFSYTIPGALERSRQK